MNVLILGDSHTFGSYGTNLQRKFEAAGHKVTRVGRVGATAGSYLSNGWKALKGSGDWDAAKQQSYDLAIMSLGTNDAAGNASPLKLKEVADQIKAGTLWYVGPPSFSATAASTYNPAFKKEDLNTRSARFWTGASALFPGKSIDPRPATKPFVQEREIHFNARGGKAWADYVYSVVAGSGVSPSTMNYSKVALYALPLAILVIWGYSKYSKARPALSPAR